MGFARRPLVCGEWGEVDPAALITGTVGLDGVDAAFAALGSPDIHAKVLIDPRSAATVPETITLDQ